MGVFIIDIFLTFLDLEQKLFERALKLTMIEIRLITMNPNDFLPNWKFKMATRGYFSQKNGLNGNGLGGGAGDIVAGGGYTLG